MAKSIYIDIDLSRENMKTDPFPLKILRDSTVIHLLEPQSHKFSRRSIFAGIQISTKTDGDVRKMICQVNSMLLQVTTSS